MDPSRKYSLGGQKETCNREIRHLAAVSEKLNKETQTQSQQLRQYILCSYVTDTQSWQKTFQMDNKWIHSCMKQSRSPSILIKQQLSNLQ